MQEITMKYKFVLRCLICKFTSYIELLANADEGQRSHIKKKKKLFCDGNIELYPI